MRASAALVLLTLLPLGCDEVEPVPEERTLARLAPLSTSVCPDPVTGEGRGTVIAQLFASDGSTVTEGSFTFSTDRGVLESGTDPDRTVPLGPLEEPVGSIGRATVVVRAPRAPDDSPVRVTALSPAGATLETAIAWPQAPELTLSAIPNLPRVGQVVTVTVDMTSVCNVVGLSMEIEFDPTVMEFVDAKPGGALETGGSPPGPVPTALEASETAPGRVSVVYRQTGATPPGTNAPGRFLSLRFRAREPGLPRLRVPAYAVTPTDGVDYPARPVSLPVLSVAAEPL